MTLENPVLLKEMRVRMRGGRTYWLMAGYVATLGVFFFIMYWSVRDRFAVSATVSPRFAQELGRSFYTCMCMVQVILGVLIAPALTAGALTIEREQRTFDLLALSLVRPRSVVFGKLVSALSFAVLLIFASAPLVGTCFMLGGVDTREFTAAYAFILGNAFFFGIVGLSCSSVCLRTTSATSFAYGIVGFFIAGSSVIALLMSYFWNNRFAAVSEFLHLLNPIVIIGDLCYGFKPMGVLPSTALWGLPTWSMTLLLYTAFSIPLLWVAVLRTKPWSEGEGRAKAPKKNTDAAKPSPTPQPAPTGEWWLPLEVANPVLKRELLSRLRSRKPLSYRRAMGIFFSSLLVGLYVYIVSLMFRYTDTPQGWATWWMGLAYCQLVLISFIAPSLTANVFTVEKEQRTLEALLLTRLMPQEICWGKLWARLISIVMMTTIFLPVTLLSAAMGGVNLIAFLGSYGLLMVTSFALGMMGMACSALFRKTGTALAAAMVAAVSVLMILPVTLAFMLGIFGFYRRGGTEATEVMLGCVSPYVSLGMLASTTSRWGSQDMHNYLIWLLCCALFSLMAYVLFRLTCEHVNKLSRV